MKSLILASISFLVAPVCVWATCADFDQMVTQSHQLQAQLGDLSQAECRSKPDEHFFNDLIFCFESIPSSQPVRLRAQSALELSGLYGAITQCYRIGLGKHEPGKKSFGNLVGATQIDPTYEEAWLVYGETIYGMSAQGYFQRKAIEYGLGISIDEEVYKAIKGLSYLPQTPAVEALLKKLRQATLQDM